jgi:hypothetical protein
MAINIEDLIELFAITYSLDADYYEKNTNAFSILLSCLSISGVTDDARFLLRRPRR